jgi:hypothetical protein
MSERFPDEVLLRVIAAYKSHEDDQSSISAMRAVLEAHDPVCAFCEHPLADHDAYGCKARRCDCMPESARP